MKHSDIHVTGPTDKQTRFLQPLRRLFFLAGYLALMAVATGIASPKPADEFSPIAGLNPLETWSSPLIMKCEAPDTLSPLRTDKTKPRSCLASQHATRSDLSDTNSEESNRIDKF